MFGSARIHRSGSIFERCITIEEGPRQCWHLGAVARGRYRSLDVGVPSYPAASLFVRVEVSSDRFGKIQVGRRGLLRSCLAYGDPYS